MRKGLQILESQIGKKLENGLIQSFYLDSEIIDLVNVLYLKFDNWIQVTTTDETSIRKIEENYPEKISSWITDDNVKFEYPMSEIEKMNSNFTSYKNKILTAFSELTEIKYNQITCGLKLYFENDLTLIIYSNAEEETYLKFDGIIPNDMAEKTLYNTV